MERSTRVDIRCVVGVVLACIVGAGSPANAQLTAGDIAALRDRGRIEGWSFTVGESQATQYPLEALCGTVVPENWRDGAPFDPMPASREQPSSFDWRDVNGRNYCTPVKSQADCGACWAFAACGAIESNILIHNGPVVDLSEQWLVSCTGAGSCSGGWAGDACGYMQCTGGDTDPCVMHGAVLEADFPYEADDSSCSCPYPHPYCLDHWAFVGPQWAVPTVEQIKQAILLHGPVAVAVSVGDPFHAYSGGVFNHEEDGPINHAVVLVGWDDSQGTDGVWILRNSWSSTWGESGYMQIAYGCSRIGFGAVYVRHGASAVELRFEYPDGTPRIITPNEPTTFRVNVHGVTGTPVPDTGRLHYWINDTSYSWSAMTQIAPNEYEATFPRRSCLDRVEWFVTVEEETAGVTSDPPVAPSVLYPAVVSTAEIIHFEDDFESDRGWSIESGADIGDWERAAPEEVTSALFVSQPGEDQSPGGSQCFVTGPLAGSEIGSYDVDGGPTRLISPAIDVAGVDAYVSYWRWFHISSEWDDVLRVEVSSDDGASWTLVEAINHRQEWTHARWQVSPFAYPTADLRVRFTMDDSPNNSLLEALIDDFRVVSYTCELVESCDDGILNQGEDRIDCGGPCPPCECLDDATCDDGLYCDGVEICNAHGICQAGTAVQCTDFVTCTIDSCNEDTDSCEHDPDHGFCDDALFCNGDEVCDRTAGCLPGLDVDCDDGIPCTVDLCYEAYDLCIHLPEHTACDDGLYCTGEETCDPDVGCLSGDDPCGAVPGTWCREATQSCEPYGTGDFDADGDVDLRDAARFQACVGQSASGPCGPGELAGDGTIDLVDYAAFAARITGPE